MSSSRRNFLVAGIGLPALATASRSADPEPQTRTRRPSDIQFEYRTLGNTGLKVTAVGMGCMVTSDGSVVERAADMGITYFDTARGYSGGNNERMVGAALKAKRNSITLSSKSHARTGPEALNDLDTSLKELGTDHLDIWYLHNKTKPEDVTDDLLEAQQTAKKAGKIRFAGVSTHSGQPTLIPWLAKNPHVDVVLSAYNFTLDPGVGAALEQAAAAGKGVVAMKVMAGGFRTIKPGDPAYPKLKQDGGLLAALKWAMRNPKVVHTTIPSITDNDQLEENLTAMGHPISVAEQKLLAERMELIRPLYCRTCGECDDLCRQGLPVADMLRILTYADGYGQFALGRERFLELDPAHTSVKCGDCPSCTVQCPHGVKVVERLIRAQELFAC
jgi:aryl-alcohol dehydrogenase-like predicted oxidoreductase